MVERSGFSSAPFVLAVSSLVLFVLSALGGVMVAYDRMIALEKLLALLMGIVVAICIAYVGSFNWRAMLPIVLGFTLFTVARNFPTGTASLVDSLGEPIVIILPLCAGWIAYVYQRDRLINNFLLGGSFAVVLIAAVIFFIVVGDLSSGIALLVALAVMIWLITQQYILFWHHGWSLQFNRVLFGTAIVLLLIYSWSIASPAASATIAQWMPGPVLQRWQRYHDFLAIVSDYPFTGSGLAVSTMVYSSYLFLVQVPFLAQAHNLFLQLAVEQGIPGLIAFVGLIIATLWGLQKTVSHSAADQTGQPRIYLLATAATGALIAIIINGLLDADLYSGAYVELLFVPFGVAWALRFSGESQQTVTQYTYEHYYGVNHHPVPSWWSWRERIGIGFAAIAPLLLIAATFYSAGGFAALYANAGAVAQTRAELSIYQWPQWPLQDYVRRMEPQQLILAENFYNAALERDPNNVTAQWRLGGIELAQGEYGKAEEHLVHAHTLAPNQRAIRQLLGEIYAIQGKAEQAIQLWQPLDLSQNQLQLRLWWYTMLGDSIRAQNLQETIRIYEQRACCF